MSHPTYGFVNRQVAQPAFTSGSLIAQRNSESASDRPSTDAAFRAMLTDIEITEVDRAHASAQQDLLRQRLEKQLYIDDTFLTGSYRRHTIRRPLLDIDVFAVLDKMIYRETIPFTPAGAEAALDLIENALRKLYPRSEIKRHDRCIQITFSNTGIGFDVIPAYQTNRDEFWIPDGPRGWIKTNPKKQQEMVTEANQGSCECMLVPAVKLIKTFNEAHGRLLHGFHIEAMVYHALKFAPPNHQASVLLLLETLSTAVLVRTPDIWPEGEDADRYLPDDKRFAASVAFRDASRKAAEAVMAENEGRIEAAHALWYEIFGEDYPETGAVPDLAPTPPPLSAMAAVESIRSGRASSANSEGLVASGLYYFARSSTDHGGNVDAAPAPAAEIGASVTVDHRDRLEYEIARAQSQFTALKRLDPHLAAGDPELWPVTKRSAEGLYAVLVGEQRSNLGRRHRILVTIPKNFPALEAKIFPLVRHVRHVPGPRGFRPLRGYRHLWADGSMCTHAGRDRWDGRLVTLLIYAADWLVRQDHFQRTGAWVGAEIGKRGELRINGRRIDDQWHERRSS